MIVRMKLCCLHKKSLKLVERKLFGLSQSLYQMFCRSFEAAATEDGTAGPTGDGAAGDDSAGDKNGAVATAAAATAAADHAADAAVAGPDGTTATGGSGRNQAQ